jgi:putative transposase
MTNHVHLIAAPEKDTSLALVLSGAHAEYARYINTSYNRCGHLWQARYFSCPMDISHAFRALAYIECNPVRAQMVEEPSSYRWSSAAAHCGSGRESIELSDVEWSREYTFKRWRSVLASGVSEEAFGERLREATRLGFAIGAKPFLETLQSQLARSVQHVHVGRPRKALSAAA